MTKRRGTIIGAAVVVVIIGGALLYTQLASGPSGTVEGPGMLYFYAVW